MTGKAVDLFDYYYDLYGRFYRIQTSRRESKSKTMGGSKSTEGEARKMTIYFDKRAEEESAKIAAAEEKEAQKQKIKQ